MIDEHAPYTVYKADMSYFSGKLEAYMRYKDIPHTPVDVDMVIMNRDIYPSTGVRKVPAVKCANGEWLFDTTPMMQWFEQRYPTAPILPDDPALAFMALLLEDYGDEWLWRPSMYWRWEQAASRRLLAWRIGVLANMGSLVAKLFGRYYASRQRKEWLWNDGVDRQNIAEVRDLYLQELAFLQSVFEKQPYILGSHPSAADFGYFGSMFRHFGNDPDPAEVMRREAPAVYEWLARLWNCKAGRLPAEQRWNVPAGEQWQQLLSRLTADYLPYLQQNAEAWRAGKKRFDFSGKSVSFRQTVTTRYRVWCLQQLQCRFAELDDESARIVAVWIQPYGGEAILRGEIIDSGMDDELRLPKADKPRSSLPAKHRFSIKEALLGRPRN